MEAKELIERIKTKSTKADVRMYRQAFMTVLFKRGVPEREIARVMDVRPPAVTKAIRRMSDMLYTGDTSYTDVYYETIHHSIAILTENVLAKATGTWRKVICKSITIDGLNFEV